jgi:putative transposase
MRAAPALRRPPADRGERVREAGVIRSQAVLIAIGVDLDGRRGVLAVELANRESATSWRDVLLGRKERGLHGVELVVSDDHAGLKAAIREVLPAAAPQRCGACARAGLLPDPGVHFLRNALDHLPRKADDDRLQELRWRGACPPAGRAGPGGPARAGRGEAGPGGVAHQVAGQVPEAHRLGRGEHRGDPDLPSIAAHAPQAPEVDQHARAAERGDQAADRSLPSARPGRTRGRPDLPNGASCLRLIRALAVEVHEDWLEAHRYLNMEDLKEHQKEQLRLAARAVRGASSWLGSRAARPVPPATMAAQFAELDAPNCGAPGPAASAGPLPHGAPPRGNALPAPAP